MSHAGLVDVALVWHSGLGQWKIRRCYSDVFVGGELGYHNGVQLM